MMKHLRPVLIFFFSFLSIENSYSQIKSINGRVVSGNEGVPYATIGIKGKNIGTVADEHGRFKIDLKIDDISPEQDKVVFSCVGFLDLVLDFKTLKDNSQLMVNLVKNDIALNEVAITPRKVKQKRFGKTGTALLTSTTIFTRGEEINDALGREIGMVLKIDESSWIKDFNVFVTGNQFKKVKFRLQFYDMEGERPVLIPMSKDIIFDVDVRKGWVNVDLKPYNIFIEGKEKVGVTMQWINSEPLDEKSKYFVISGVNTLGSIGLYRAKSESSWTRPKYNLSMYVTADTYH